MLQPYYAKIFWLCQFYVFDDVCYYFKVGNELPKPFLVCPALVLSIPSYDLSIVCS